MTRYLVTNVYQGLNLRPTPSTAQAPLETMPFATQVELLEDTGTKWKKVRVLAPGSGRVGYASAAYMTLVRSDAIARLVQAAAHYWELFDRGAGREDVQPYKDHVLQMWDDLGGGRPPGDNTSHPGWPWSAAGMSAFVRRAGGYDGFKFSAGHARYIHDAIVKRNAGQAAPFWGHRITERRPQVGDLIAQWRVTKIGYDHAAAWDDFSSHTDLVVQVLGDSVRAIGANVPTDTVGVKVYRTGPDGFLLGTRNEIAVMENRAA
ncbi:MAG: DUF2272 domain-containing protein [Fuscovulum sp.]|nr:DUF2272 domain-containing protein [Fuscovulum sp.]